MKEALCIALFFVTITGCLTGKQGSLAGRWDFKGVDMPDVAGFIDSIKSSDEDAKYAMESFFRGNALILRTNSTYDLVICKKYLHGNWKLDDANNLLQLTDEAGYLPPITLKVNKNDPLRLVITADNETMAKLVPAFQYGTTGYSYFQTKRRFTFFLSTNDDSYWQDKDDPYSKVNNQWRIKPRTAETNEQITLRVKEHLQFCRLLVKDAIEKQGVLSFNWFATPLVLSTSGCGLREYRYAKDEWAANFYDSAQALQGFRQLAQTIHRTTYQPDETRSRFSNYAFMLDGLIEQVEKEQP